MENKKKNKKQKNKKKNNNNRALHAFPRAFWRLRVYALNCDWLVALSALIALSNSSKRLCLSLLKTVPVLFIFSSYVISDCYYDGILHEHGERWSPGPCTPECKCDDGKIHCTLIECPELSCHNPIKKRWKCCPECPAEEGEMRFYYPFEDVRSIPSFNFGNRRLNQLKIYETYKSWFEVSKK